MINQIDSNLRPKNDKLNRLQNVLKLVDRAMRKEDTSAQGKIVTEILQARVCHQSFNVCLRTRDLRVFHLFPQNSCVFKNKNIFILNTHSSLLQRQGYSCTYVNATVVGLAPELWAHLYIHTKKVRVKSIENFGPRWRTLSDNTHLCMYI
jgi:hypothetical protein